jgi:TorA maturation chaperone TorD
VITVEKESIGSSEFQQLAQSRSKLYGFLSALYVKIPNEEFAANLLSDKFQSLLQSISQSVSGEMKKGLKTIEGFVNETRGRPRTELAQELGVDWTRLFRGLKRGYGPPPPYESVYIESSEQDARQTIGEVMKTYREAGVSVDEKAGQRSDYIGIELDFMRHLAEKEMEMWTRADYQEAMAYLGKEDDFLVKHIVRWIPKFCDKVLAEAQTDFYKGVALFTKGFLKLEEESIKGYVRLIEKNWRI